MTAFNCCLPCRNLQEIKTFPDFKLFLLFGHDGGPVLTSGCIYHSPSWWVFPLLDYFLSMGDISGCWFPMEHFLIWAPPLCLDQWTRRKEKNHSFLIILVSWTTEESQLLQISPTLTKNKTSLFSHSINYLKNKKSLAFPHSTSELPF